MRKVALARNNEPIIVATFLRRTFHYSSLLPPKTEHSLSSALFLASSRVLPVSNGYSSVRYFVSCLLDKSQRCGTFISAKRCSVICRLALTPRFVIKILRWMNTFDWSITIRTHQFVGILRIGAKSMYNTVNSFRHTKIENSYFQSSHVLIGAVVIN